MNDVVSGKDNATPTIPRQPARATPTAQGQILFDSRRRTISMNFDKSRRMVSAGSCEDGGATGPHRRPTWMVELPILAEIGNLPQSENNPSILFLDL